MTSGQEDYLLDTSVLSRLLNPEHRDHRTVSSWERGLPPGSRRLLSVVALAELRFGLELARQANRHQRLPALEKMIADAEQRTLLPITPATALSYARLKSATAAKYMPKRLQQQSNRSWGNPETWTDEFTGTALQIQENDLWQCAQAVERDVVLVVADQRIERIAAASGGQLRLHCLTTL